MLKKVCFISSSELFLGTKEFIKQMEDGFKVKNIRLKRRWPREEEDRKIESSPFPTLLTSEVAVDNLRGFFSSI